MILLILIVISYWGIVAYLGRNHYQFTVEFHLNRFTQNLSSKTRIYYDGVPVGRVISVSRISPNDQSFSNEEVGIVQVEIEMPISQIIYVKNSSFSSSGEDMSVREISSGGEVLIDIRPAQNVEKKHKTISKYNPKKCYVDIIICDGSTFRGINYNYYFDTRLTSDYIPGLSTSKELSKTFKQERLEFCPAQFWIDNPNKWGEFSPEDNFNDIFKGNFDLEDNFDFNLFDPDTTLSQALQGGQKFKHKMAQVATIFLLNRSHPYLISKRWPINTFIVADLSLNPRGEYMTVVEGIGFPIYLFEVIAPSLIEHTSLTKEFKGFIDKKELVNNKNLLQSIMNTELFSNSDLPGWREAVANEYLLLVNNYIKFINDFDTIINDENIESFLEKNCPLADIQSID